MTNIEPSKVDFAELANRLLEENAAPVKRSNRKTRVSEWNGSIETLPQEKATQAVAIFNTFLDENFGSVLEGTEPRELEEVEVVALATELGKARTLSEMATAVNERAKKLVFDHGDKTGQSGDFVLDIPEMEMRFRRGNSEPGDPVADWDRLNEVVDTDEDFDTLAPETYILTLSKEEYDYLMGRVNQGFRDNVEVNVDRQIDKDAAMRYVMESKERQKKFAGILTPGTARSGSFYFEPIPKGK